MGVILKMKNLTLKVDEAFFYKMKEDKLKQEKELGKNMTWEDYIKLLFNIK